MLASLKMAPAMVKDRWIYVVEQKQALFKSMEGFKQTVMHYCVSHFIVTDVLASKYICFFQVCIKGRLVKYD